LSSCSATNCAAAASLVFQLLASACDSGDGYAFAPDDSQATSRAPVRPALRIEHDADGAAYLRVIEQTFSPFGATGAVRVMSNQRFGPAPGSNRLIEGAASTLIAKFDIVEMKHGLTLQQSGAVSIIDYTYVGFDGDGSIFGAAIKLGDNDRPTDGPTYIQRVSADGKQAPDPTYKVSNTDFIGIEDDSGPVFVRDVSARNFGDAGVDSKSNQIYVMNATLEGAHRMIRAWPGVEITLVNVIINAAPGHAQGWVYDDTATIRHFNTLWCLNASKPSAGSPDCRAAPWIVESDTLTENDTAKRFVALATNPLPGVSPFFRTSMDEIVAEYSVDDGDIWISLPLLNAGRAGSPPVGDTRYRIPFDLDDGAFLFRARYRLNGANVGEMSAPIDEDSKIVVTAKAGAAN
jgi:hypothetical protein